MSGPAMQAVIFSVFEDSFLQLVTPGLNVTIVEELQKLWDVYHIQIVLFLTCCSDFPVLLCSFQLNPTFWFYTEFWPRWGTG